MFDWHYNGRCGVALFANEILARCKRRLWRSIQPRRVARSRTSGEQAYVPALKYALLQDQSTSASRTLTKPGFFRTCIQRIPLGIKGLNVLSRTTAPTVQLRRPEIGPFIPGACLHGLETRVVLWCTLEQPIVEHYCSIPAEGQPARMLAIRGRSWRQ